MKRNTKAIIEPSQNAAVTMSERDSNSHSTENDHDAPATAVKCSNSATQDSIAVCSRQHTLNNKELISAIEISRKLGKKTSQFDVFFDDIILLRNIDDTITNSRNKLLEINLSGNRICKHLVQLSIAISQCNSLKILDLSHNRLCDANISTFQRSMETILFTVRTLKYISLSHNEIRNSFVAVIREILHTIGQSRTTKNKDKTLNNDFMSICPSTMDATNKLEVDNIIDTNTVASNASPEQHHESQNQNFSFQTTSSRNKTTRTTSDASSKQKSSTKTNSTTEGGQVKTKSGQNALLTNIKRRLSASSLSYKARTTVLSPKRESVDRSLIGYRLSRVNLSNNFITKYGALNLFPTAIQANVEVELKNNNISETEWARILRKLIYATTD